MPLAGAINCGPSPDKSARSWYSDIDADPWLTYMYETCKPVGRYDDVVERLRTRFLAAEQSAVERGFQEAILQSAGGSLTGGSTLSSGIGALEDLAAETYGGQIILHLPMRAGTEAARQNLIRQVGDHLETWAGNPVVIGNYDSTVLGGTPGTNTDLYATGAMDLYRSPLVEAGPVMLVANNDYFALVERAYAAVVDCFVSAVTVPLCDCGNGDSGGGPVTQITLARNQMRSSIELRTLCGSERAETAARLNAAGVVADPQTSWGGECAFVECRNGVTDEVTWDGTSWQAC